MKEYRIRVLLNSGTTSYFAVDTRVKGEIEYSGNGYHKFINSDGRISYYPIINTIIEQQ